MSTPPQRPVLNDIRQFMKQRLDLSSDQEEISGALIKLALWDRMVREG